MGKGKQTLFTTNEVPRIRIPQEDVRYNRDRTTGVERLDGVLAQFRADRLRYFQNEDINIEPCTGRFLYQNYDLPTKTKLNQCSEKRQDDKEMGLGHLCEVRLGKEITRKMQIFTLIAGGSVNSRYLNCPKELEDMKSRIHFWENCIFAIILAEEILIDDKRHVTPRFYGIDTFDALLKKGCIDTRPCPSKKHAMIIYFRNCMPTAPWKGGGTIIKQPHFVEALTNFIRGDS